MANNAQTRTALLLTRPKDSAERFLARLNSDLLSGVRVCVSPLLQIAPRGIAPDLTEHKGVIFTSEQALAFAPAPTSMPAYCVGAQTAKRAAAAGWDVRLVTQTAEELIADILGLNLSGPLVHLAGAHRRGDIALRLRERGTLVTVKTLYDQELLPLTSEARALLDGKGRVVAPMFSPRTAAQFLDQGYNLKRVEIIAISAAVAAIFQEVAVNGIVTTQAPTGNDMARAVEMALQKDSLA